MSKDETIGWEWFEAGQRSGGTETEPDDAAAALALAYARCFSTPEGETVLAHLRRATLERVFGPAAPDALLRHVEGQRHLVAQIIALVAQGRGEN